MSASPCRPSPDGQRAESRSIWSVFALSNSIGTGLEFGSDDMVLLLGAGYVTATRISLTMNQHGTEGVA